MLPAERGLQAAETCVLYGASEFSGALFYPPNSGWWHAFEWLGTVAAGGRFCGLKAALRSPARAQKVSS